MKTIYLIRHGSPDYPEGEAVCMGMRFDLPLSPEGREQAEALSRCRGLLPVEAVYASPARRCLETAQPLAAGRGLAVTVLDDLRELYGGLWDGMTRREIQEQYADYFRPGRQRTPPGGESDQDAWVRGQRLLQRLLRDTDACCACVTHSSLMRVIMCAVNGIPFGEKRDLRVEHAGVVPLTWDGARWACPSRSMHVQELSRG